MADRPQVKARVLSRKEVAALTDDPRLRAALEAIFGDVAATLPDASLANAEAAEGAQATADDGVTRANAAQASADTAQATATAAQADADAAQADIDSHRASNIAHGTTGAVVGTTDVQWLTNKTLGAGTKLASQTLSTGGNTPTLGANLPGPAGPPTNWCKLNINGTDYWMPLWAV